jgi:single-stranded-DNA-specific exonuclease
VVALSAGDTAFLGVAASLTGRRWTGPDTEEERLAAALVQRASLDHAVAAVLARRGVPPEEAAGFLSPSLRDLLPDPATLKDMDAASARIAQALARRERIAIFADYDVDGGSSAALLIDWLRRMGHGATLYVPDRIDEGYGPNEPAMAKLAETHDLIVCVDCGTLSHGPIAAAKGADVIVLDHHLAEADLPDCVAVVNPNRQDEDGSLGHLCAAAVVFLLLVDLNRRLRAEGVAGPDLMAMLDLVALATVADVAPLRGVNRAFVRQGLTVMARRHRKGLVALCDVARLDRAPTGYHLGFVLGPRVNAGGRIGEADLGARLLATDDPEEAMALARRLDTLNTDRREIEARVREAALAQAEARGLDAPARLGRRRRLAPRRRGHRRKPPEGTHPPPRRRHRFRRGGGQGLGPLRFGRRSGRVDPAAGRRGADHEGRRAQDGGGPVAQPGTAGARHGAALGASGAAGRGRGRRGRLRLDGVLMPEAATPELIERIEAAGPFGASAPAPRFAFPAMRIRMTRPVGEGHLKLGFSDGATGSIDAIAFDAARLGLDALQNHQGRPVHLAGRVELNHWNGRSRVQLRLEDAAWAE